MKRIRLPILISIICMCASVLSANTERPNIILVMTDDQGWGQTGYNGHPHLKTPNLDAMAKNGIRFDRFYAAAATCTPTRASVMTGRLPRRTGAPAISGTLSLQEKTLPQALQKAGYTTAHFGKWHLGGVKGNGMPVLEDSLHHPGAYGFDYWLSTTNFFDMDPLMSRNGEFVYIEGDSSDIIVDDALKFIEREKDNPFLAVIWYGSPHFPFRTSEEDVAPYKALGFDDKHAYHLAEIAAMDRSVGTLRQGLRDMGIAENTIVWFCSDNGGLKDDPHSGGKLTGNKGALTEGGIRVPGIIEWPGTIKPTITNFPASTMDIMPTFVDLLELPQDSMLSVVDGESIKDIFFGNTPSREKGIAFLEKGKVLITENFKLRNLSKKRNNPKWELFDVDADPGEHSDISTQFPELMERMKAELQGIMASVEESEAGKDYPEGERIRTPQPKDKRWSVSPDYIQHFATFEEMKPGWTAPKQKK
ncbi:MAG: sulfatase family protein [Opitutales bacterium]